MKDDLAFVITKAEATALNLVLKKLATYEKEDRITAVGTPFCIR